MLEIVKALGSLTAIFFAFVYASGFVVVHVYLGEIGIVAFGLLSVQYLAAGILFLCSVCLIWAPIGAGKLLVRGFRPPFVNTLVYHFIVSMGWILAALLFGYVGVAVRDMLKWLVPVGTGLLIFRMSTLLKIRLLPNVPILMRALLIGSVPGFLMWSVLTATFATFVYPHVYREIGGGRPVRIELIMARGNHPLSSGMYDVLVVTDRHWIVGDTAADRYFVVSSEDIRMATLRGAARLKPFRRGN